MLQRRTLAFLKRPVLLRFIINPVQRNGPNLIDILPVSLKPTLSELLKSKISWDATGPKTITYAVGQLHHWPLLVNVLPPETHNLI